MTQTALILALLACSSKTGEGQTAGECIDEIDNDEDGLIDCEDDGCDAQDFCDGGDSTGGGDGGDDSADGGDGGDDGGDGGDDGGDSGDDTGPVKETGDTDTTSAWAALCINEFMASNTSTLQDEKGAFPDWIELHNSGGEPLSLEGVTITDDLKETGKHVLGNIQIPAGGFVLLYADGDVKEGDLHLGFSLSAEGESLGLYDPDGEQLDALNFPNQISDVSAYRTADCGDTWDYTETPTPGASNE